MIELTLIQGGLSMKKSGRLRVQTTSAMNVCQTPLRKNEEGMLLRVGEVLGKSVCYVRFRRIGEVLPMWPNEIEPVLAE
jgi:hypothetical protein